MTRRQFMCCSMLCVLTCQASVNGRAGEVIDTIDVEPVWAGHPVGFSLLTVPPYQYVAYYDAQRQMTVAQRNLSEMRWTFAKLPSHIGWDSHNYVTMAVDRDGFLHVAGNMHCVPLVYFRSSALHDVRSLTRIVNMVGAERERAVTYPVFLRRLDDQLVFRYRDGRSGNGDDIYNVYEESARHWQRLLDKPLTSGQGQMNAYCSQPQLGPDRVYHIVWVWRDTPDCATNHELSYARSRDLVHWETAGGHPLSLPITIDSGAVVDPVPPHGGMINGGQRLGFDAQNRPVIVYHKFDETGNTQIYAARFESRGWRIRQISNWRDYRWEFSGGGSIPFEVRINTVRDTGQGLRVECSYGRGRATWLLDNLTLEQVKDVGRSSKGSRKEKRRSVELPAASSAVTDTAGKPSTPDLQRRTASDRGSGRSADYRLQWYALGPHRDRPRLGPPPPPVMLQVLKVSR